MPKGGGVKLWTTKMPLYDDAGNIVGLRACCGCKIPNAARLDPVREIAWPHRYKEKWTLLRKNGGLPLGACPQIISSKSGASDRRVPTPGINIWRVNFREESDDSFW